MITVNRKKGFTLIELLVVIAIIAILAAILFPVFAKAREKARQAACLSNCKQTALAVQMYTDDYDGVLPSVFNGPWSANPEPWMMLLLPYVKNAGVFNCPSFAGPWQPKTTADLGMAGCGILAYGINIDVFGYTPASLTQLDQPADTLYACDSNGADCVVPGDNGMLGSYEWDTSYPCDPSKFAVYPASYAGANPFANRPTARHNNMINCTFCDGHAKALAFSELTKQVQNTGGRSVVTYPTQQMLKPQWTSNTNIMIFPYFATDATNGNHW